MENEAKQWVWNDGLIVFSSGWGEHDVMTNMEWMSCTFEWDKRDGDIRYLYIRYLYKTIVSSLYTGGFSTTNSNKDNKFIGNWNNK